MDFQQFVDHLRRALNHLYDPDYLRRSPIAGILGLDGRFNTPLAVQDMLILAITDLHSDHNDPAQNQALQEILQYRYVEQFTQDEVALQLGVSTRQLRRKQKNALEVLAWALWETYQPNTVIEPSAPDLSAPPQPRLTESLAWLETATHNQQTDLLDLLQSIRELAHPLARKHNAQLLFSHDSNLPAIAS